MPVSALAVTWPVLLAFLLPRRIPALRLRSSPTRVPVTTFFAKDRALTLFIGLSSQAADLPKATSSTAAIQSLLESRGLSVVSARLLGVEGSRKPKAALLQVVANDENECSDVTRALEDLKSEVGAASRSEDVVRRRPRRSCLFALSRLLSRAGGSLARAPN